MLTIAGSALGEPLWSLTFDKADRLLTEKGATGCGVRLLNEFLSQNFEA